MEYSSEKHLAKYSLKKLLAKYPDRKLNGLEDCVKILGDPGVADSLFYLAEKLTRYKMIGSTETDKQIVAGAVSEAIFEKINNREDVQKRLSDGYFTLTSESVSNAVDPSVHEMFRSYGRFSREVARNKISEKRRNQRLPKKQQTDPDGAIRYATSVELAPDFGSGDALDLSTGGSRAQPHGIEEYLIEKERERERRDALTKYRKTIADIVSYQRQFLETKVGGNSTDNPHVYRALLGWQFDDFKTADEAAQSEGVDAKKVREVWYNLSRVRDGRCPLHRWALKEFPEKHEKINATFNSWYWYKERGG